MPEASEQAAARPARSTSASRVPTVALVGPNPSSRGGIATAMRLMRDSQLADEFRIEWISTQRDGRLGSKMLEATRGIAILSGKCARRRLDLVHLHVSTRGSLARKSVAVAIARSARVPVVVHVHSGGFFEAGERPAARIQNRAFRWVLESADTVVALTPAWKRNLEARARIKRLRVVPNAPDLVAAPTPGNASPGNLVLYLGHLYRAKGLYDLLEAFAVVRESRDRLRLVLAGEGPEAHHLGRFAAELGLEVGAGAAVELPGWVGPPEKATLLAEAACLVLPSHNEGLPLVLLEAMHAGVPIIATSVGGVPDVVRDGREALLVPPHDVEALSRALSSVVDDPQLAEGMAGAAHERALARFTPEAMAARLAGVYRETLAGRIRRRRAPDATTRCNSRLDAARK
jgi:glycosyltransferase involved in cell wall biosynthesis